MLLLITGVLGLLIHAESARLGAQPPAQEKAKCTESACVKMAKIENSPYCPMYPGLTTRESCWFDASAGMLIWCTYDPSLKCAFPKDGPSMKCKGYCTVNTGIVCYTTEYLQCNQVADEIILPLP
jgi:hypothetical protein